jgi:hypothetical protein
MTERSLVSAPVVTHNAARAEYDRAGGIGLGAEPSNSRQEYARTDRAAVHAINWNVIAPPSAIVRDLAAENSASRM